MDKSTKIFVLWFPVLILKFKKQVKKKSILTRNELTKEETQSHSLYSGPSRLLHSKFYIWQLSERKKKEDENSPKYLVPVPSKNLTGFENAKPSLTSH